MSFWRLKFGFNGGQLLLAGSLARCSTSLFEAVGLLHEDIYAGVWLFLSDRVGESIDFDRTLQKPSKP